MYLFLIGIASAVPLSYIPPTRIPPSKRSNSVMDYKISQDILILFSGKDSSDTNNDIWSFSLSENYWTQLIPSCEVKPGNPYLAKRANSSCFASKLTENFYIFAGFSELGLLNDLWAYQILNFKWVELVTIDPPTSRHNFAYTSYIEGGN